MALQELLEVAIGLIFAWLIISIATMQVQESIASLLGKRASDLEKVIREMIANPNMVKEFYSHPLIKSLSKPLSQKKQDAIKAIESKPKPNPFDKFNLWRIKPKPSYIPSKNFALALFDVMTKAGTEESPIHTTLSQLKDGINNLAMGDKDTAQTVLNGIYQLGQMAARTQAGSEFQAGLKKELQNQIVLLGNQYKDLQPASAELLNVVNESKYDLGDVFKSELALDQVREGAKALGQDQALGRSIQTLFAGVEEYASNAEKALAVGRENVEEWFNNSMDRMSGWYKRWAQVWAFFIALLLAVAFNVDTINIVDRLWNNPALREASSAYIESYVNQQTQSGKELNTTELNAKLKELQIFEFPIGWKKDFWTEYSSDPWIKSLGFLITALAAMQGAPFWFDILKKLVNVRGAGINPSEKPKETTSDKER